VPQPPNPGKIGSARPVSRPNRPDFVAVTFAWLLVVFPSRLMNRKVPKQFEIRLVQRDNRPDPRDVKGGGQQRVEQPLAAEPVLPHPREELIRCGHVGNELDGFRGVPQGFGPVEGGGHAQRVGAAPRVGHDMDELGKNLRDQCKAVAAAEEPVEQGSGLAMPCMRDEFNGDQE